MSAKTETILSVGYVTDHDCGNYAIGEVDTFVHGNLTTFLEQHGDKGADELMKSLAWLCKRTGDEVYAWRVKNSGAECGSAK